MVGKIKYIFIFLFLISGCTVPVKNVSQLIQPRKINLVEYRIAQALIALNWSYDIKRKGHIVAMKSNRDAIVRTAVHSALIDILYEENGYKIKYKSSYAFKYDGENIHRSYNTLIENLDDKIQSQLNSGEVLPGGIQANKSFTALDYGDGRRITKRYRKRPTTESLVAPSAPKDSLPGTPVYSPDECIGPVINGVCHGSILEKNVHRKRCYGEMLNGQCTGPIF